MIRITHTFNGMGDRLDEFHLFLLQRGIKESTVRLHLRNLNIVVKKYGEISRPALSALCIDYKSQGLKNSYINFFINSAKVYGDFSQNTELSSLKYLKEDTFVKSTMSDAEIIDFINLPPPTRNGVNSHGKICTKTCDPAWYAKYTMFWKICAFTGMRMGEVAGLTVNDVDFGRNLFILEDTKTNEPRFVPIPPNISSDLQQYIHDLSGNMLFPSPRNGKKDKGRLNSVCWGYDFHNRINRLGIKRKNLTPYSLRHSIITRLLEEDVNITKVQKLVGHHRIETTLKYTHLTHKDIQQAIRKHPLVRAATTPIEIINAMVEVMRSFNLENDKRFFYRLDQSPNSVRFEAYVK